MTDARKIRTKRALFSALDEALSQMPYDAISVTELAARAGVGRQTFYRHFNSVNDVLSDRLRILLAEQRLLVRQHTGTEWFTDVTQLTFESVAAQPNLYRLILRGAAGADALGVFRAQIAALWNEAGAGTPLDGVPESLRPFIVAFHAGAVSALLLEWLEAGCSPEVAVMVRLFSDLAHRRHID